MNKEFSCLKVFTGPQFVINFIQSHVIEKYENKMRCCVLFPSSDVFNDNQLKCNSN